MVGNEHLILVINTAEDRAWQLKESIEFLDAPAVRVAAPEDWQSQIGDHRLTAVFVGNDLPKPDLDRLIGDVGKLDPNVPIVLVGEDSHA